MQKNDEINRLKREVSILSLAEKSGFTLVKHGSKDFAALCRWHDDKTPSLIFSPNKNLFNCLACADVKGSVIDWVKLTEKVNTGEAIRILKDLLPPDSAAAIKINGKEPPSLSGKEKVGAASPSPNSEADAIDITETKFQQLLKRSIEYFHRLVKNNSTALSYLQKRNLADGSLLEEFQIGFADNSFLTRLPNGKEGREIKTLLKQIGLLTEKGRLLFQDMLVFPIFSEKGEVLNIYGRRLKEKSGYGSTKLTNRPNHMYLPGKRRGIFNLKAVQVSREIILCESIIDALSFWVNGFRNVTCSYGTNGFTAEMLTALKEHKTEKIFVAYDNDDAGNKAATDLSFLLAENGIESYRVEFPDGLDANETIQRVKAPAENLKYLLQNAKVMTAVSASAKKENSLFTDIVLSEDAKKIPGEELQWEKKSGSYIFTIGNRKYCFFGVSKNLSYEILKVRLKISNEESNRVYTDNGVDLFNFKTIKSLIKSCSEKLELENQIIEKDLDKIISLLEEIQTEVIDQKMNSGKTQEVAITEDQRQQALEYLRNKDLVKNIMDDFEKIGMVGERENSLIGYLAATSRKDDKPLAIIVQSSSGAGKTTFMDAVLMLMPEEEVEKFSAMTDQSIYYFETSLKNKILAIVEEEGAERASYSLKLLQSEGKVSIASTGKDPDTGKMVTQSYEVEGPVMIFIATTNCEIDEELKNRCLILTVNESEKQTKRILTLQRDLETIEGLVNDFTALEIAQLHQNIQRLLRPIHVVNPYAKDLTFSARDHRARRDQKKYLTLIRTIAFLHQYQREIKTIKLKGRTIEYIEVTLDDIELANQLIVKIFGVSLDELAPQTRIFLEKLYDWSIKRCKELKIDQEDFRFTKREASEALEISINRAGVHLLRLEIDEYIRKWHGKRGQTNIYEVIYKGEDRKNMFVALELVNVDKLRKKYKKK